MAALRFLAALFAIVALVSLAVDATPTLTSSAPFSPRSVAAQWQAIAPKTFAGARESVSSTLSPSVWNLMESSLLAIPSFAMFGLLAALCGYLGRRRRRVEIFVN